MKRREFIAMVGAAVATWPVTAHAEQGRRRVVLISALPEKDVASRTN